MSYGAKAFYKRAIVYTIIVGCVGFNLPAWAQKAPKPQPPVRKDKEGHLVYTPDEKGNRIPDFSYAGYAAGEQSIPEIPVKIFVPVKPGDATTRIQAALDYVSTLTPDKNGFRGAVLLSRGRHELAGTLRIAATGSSTARQRYGRRRHPVGRHRGGTRCHDRPARATMTKH